MFKWLPLSVLIYESQVPLTVCPSHALSLTESAYCCVTMHDALGIASLLLGSFMEPVGMVHTWHWCLTCMLFVRWAVVSALMPLPLLQDTVTALTFPERVLGGLCCRFCIFKIRSTKSQNSLSLSCSPISVCLSWYIWNIKSSHVLWDLTNPFKIKPIIHWDAWKHPCVCTHTLARTHTSQHDSTCIKVTFLQMWAMNMSRA